jgi:hypothetical protein
MFADQAADADKFVAVGGGEELEHVAGAGEAGVAEVVVGFFAFGGEGDVDAAFVGVVELAVDEGFVEGGFEGADDAGHLGGEDADGALKFADGGGGVGAGDEVECKVLGLGEFRGGVAAGGGAFFPRADRDGEDFFGHLVEGVIGRGGGQGRYSCFGNSYHLESSLTREGREGNGNRGGGFFIVSFSHFDRRAWEGLWRKKGKRRKKEQ